MNRKGKGSRNERRSRKGGKFTGEMAEMPDAILLCDKQRNGDWEGKLGLWWHQGAFQFLDSELGRPKQYVPFGSHAEAANG